MSVAQYLSPGARTAIAQRAHHESTDVEWVGCIGQGTAKIGEISPDLHQVHSMRTDGHCNRFASSLVIPYQAYVPEPIKYRGNAFSDESQWIGDGRIVLLAAAIQVHERVWLQRRSGKSAGSPEVAMERIIEDFQRVRLLGMSRPIAVLVGMKNRHGHLIPPVVAIRDDDVLHWFDASLIAAAEQAVKPDYWSIAVDGNAPRSVLGMSKSGEIAGVVMGLRDQALGQITAEQLRQRLEAPDRWS